MRLWISVHPTRLSLDALCLSPQADALAPRVVIDHDRVVAMTPAAAQAGIRTGMRKSGIAALSPEALLLARDPAREAELLRTVALALLQYTPELALTEEDALVLEVGPSLRMFGGPRALCRRIRRTLRQLGCRARLGMAPTAQGAWLLARHGRPGRRRVLQMESLVRRLEALPCDLLPDARVQQDWLDGIGCRTLGTLRALPRAGLQKRCGKPLLLALDRAYGHAPELFEWFVPPGSFAARVEPIERVEDAPSVLALAERLVQQMAGWLAAQHQAVSRIELTLEHERGRHARPPTSLAVALADPTWHAEHLLLLLGEQLGRRALAAPVIAVGLLARETAPRTVASQTLFPEPSQIAADHRRLLELLEARLGARCVLQPQLRADYRPEVANGWQPAAQAEPQVDAVPVPAFEDRPAWLLERPLRLEVRQHRPFHGSSLRLLQGPERIESGWFDETHRLRDYYIAESEDQARYWIYQERLRDDVRWFLHGLFG